MKLHAHPSPNFGPRRDGLLPSLIVIHYTAMTSAEAALERLCSDEHEVSAHYLIHQNGDVFQMVDEDMRAWHAGAGAWAGVQDINSRSIGIELDNDGATPFGEPQMAALEALMKGIMQRWDITATGVIGHSDMAPERKVDPGFKFDWERLARQGLSVWPNPQSNDADAKDFHMLATRFGYPANACPDAVLSAVRQRFRPWAKGPLDDIDMGIIADLAARFPVDLQGPIT